MCLRASLRLRPVEGVLGFLLLVGGNALAQSASTSETAANLYAQNAAIEQARLFNRPAGTENVGMNADGAALPDSGVNNDDDSFGAQQILKTQERIPEFTVSGSAAEFYTNNVALTRDGTISDSFFVGSGGIAWNRAINPEVSLQIGAAASIFRYTDTSVLDFENLGAGIGVSWTPKTWGGASIFARYDFVELLDRDGGEILQDHEFSVGVQKVFMLGRSHALTAGALASAGISDPFAAQRDRVGGFAGYQIALTRQFQAEVLYSIAGNFYNGHGRDDFNQVCSLGLHYHLTAWAEANAMLSWGLNRSSVSAFEYDVLTTGGGVGFTFRF